MKFFVLYSREKKAVVEYNHLGCRIAHPPFGGQNDLYLFGLGFEYSGLCRRDSGFMITTVTPRRGIQLIRQNRRFYSSQLLLCDRCLCLTCFVMNEYPFHCFDHLFYSYFHFIRLNLSFYHFSWNLLSFFFFLYF